MTSSRMGTRASSYSQMLDGYECPFSEGAALMPPHAIVLSLNQLSRRCLGYYGHEWIETPNLDRLASRGVVFDQCFSSPTPELALHDATKRLCERLSGEGITVQRLSETSASDTDDFSRTAFGRLVTEAEKALTKLSRDKTTPWLLWLESAGIGWPGLATSQFVELYADELDDEVPDELVAIREIEVAYAALLTQFDHLLGGLLGTIDRLFGDAPPLIVVVGAHGQGVCEAEMLSPFADRSAELTADAGSFRDELVHVPLLIAAATSESLGSRRRELVTPADVAPTLSEWFGNSSSAVAENETISLLPLLRNEEQTSRSELFFRDSEGQAAVRTEQFLFVQPDAVAQLTTELPADDASGWLFLKPEDVWEVNDVGEQHSDQVASLRAKLQDWLRQFL